MPPGLPRRENLPITHENVREWFPSPRMENALAGDPWWQIQSLGLLCAFGSWRWCRLVPNSSKPSGNSGAVSTRHCWPSKNPRKTPSTGACARVLRPWAPSPPAVVTAILRLADIRSGDRLLDLGSGDGRIVIEAAFHGIEARGVEIDAKLVQGPPTRRQ